MQYAVEAYTFNIEINNQGETTTVQAKAWRSLARIEKPHESSSNAMSAAWWSSHVPALLAKFSKSSIIIDSEIARQVDWTVSVLRRCPAKGQLPETTSGFHEVQTISHLWRESGPKPAAPWWPKTCPHL